MTPRARVTHKLGGDRHRPEGALELYLWADPRARLVPCSPSPLSLHGFVHLNPRAADLEDHRRPEVDRELARLRGTCIEGQAQAEGELQEGKRSVSDAMLTGLRRKAEQQVLAQSNSCMCPISLALMREPVVAADGHTYERVEMKSGSG